MPPYVCSTKSLSLKGRWVLRSESRRGYKPTYSSLFVTTPQSRLTPCQLPVKGSLLVQCKFDTISLP